MDTDSESDSDSDFPPDGVAGEPSPLLGPTGAARLTPLQLMLPLVPVPPMASGGGGGGALTVSVAGLPLCFWSAGHANDGAASESSAGGGDTPFDIAKVPSTSDLPPRPDGYVTSHKP